MKVLGSAPARAPTGAVPQQAGEVTGMAASQRSDPADAVAAEPFERVARLAAMVLGTPLAAVTIAGELASFAGNSPGAPGMADWQTPAEQPCASAWSTPGRN